MESGRIQWIKPKKEGSQTFNLHNWKNGAILGGIIIAKWIDGIYALVWGAPTLLLILGTGMVLSYKTRFAQLRLLPLACREFLGKLTGKTATGEGISSFQALCTALAATVGIGNLAGVAGAIALGGPGAIFWMWVCALLGMVVKFSEATLAVSYRRKGSDGQWIGGPMYMIEDGMGHRWKLLASVYCFFGVVAAFGVGNATQVNALIGGIREAASSMGAELSPQWYYLLGLMLAALIGTVLLGGAKRIAGTAELLIPFAAGGYMLLCAIALFLRRHVLADAFMAILEGAFSPQAVTGGMVGSAFTALRTGVSRGVFTNEAGMGTASIAHAGAEVDHPVRQGLMGIMEVFLDTVVICTMTALVILCSGVPIQYGTDAGAALTSQAFCAIFGDWVGVVIAAALCLFAFATILGWGMYGARCAEYLFGDGVWRKFALLQMIAVVLGAALNTAMLWRVAEIVNGLMAIPNLIALWALSPKIKQLLQEFHCGR
jgi:AGCS family alanine or glycine:cation symporter